jgi:broad specificity phosphatase PhoE
MTATVVPCLGFTSPAETITSQKELHDKIMKIQRKKLRKCGAMDVKRPFVIKTQLVSPDSSGKWTGGDENATSNEEKVHTKIIHFQRHGQGYHNFIGNTWRELGKTVDIDSSDPDKNPFVHPEVLDAPLTALGRQEAIEKRSVAALMNPDLIIVSPLHRAIQTAHFSFADHRSRVPWIAHEGCREDLGLLVCNKRRPLSQTKEEFPYIDFSYVVSGEEDTLFKHEEMECLLAQADRVYDFLANFVRTRPEQEIAVVGHSAWLFNMCNAVVECNGDENLMAWFGTSEIRSMRVSFIESSSMSSKECKTCDW